jgi:hypothetical protein
MPSVLSSSSVPKKKKSFWWVTVLTIILPFFFIGYFVFWPDYQRERLIERGLPAEAVILKADPTGSVYNSQPEVRLRLRVLLSDGQTYEAETKMIINPMYAPQFQPGKQVKVRYDKEDKFKVAVEETENGQR